jgi:NADH-quinone oxidoreductase subunit J
VITLEFAFFGLCAVLVLLGGLTTVGASNPIRGALGLLTTIGGTAGMYLLLTAEFLAAVQIIVYAGAVVVLFIFVIMLLGPSATSPADARSAVPRYLGAGVFVVSSVAALLVLIRPSAGPTALPAAPRNFGTIEGLGRELFTEGVVPFEISGALLVVAVIGAIAVARGKQVDPTLLPAPAARDGADSKPEASPRAAAHSKEEAS